MRSIAVVGLSIFVLGATSAWAPARSAEGPPGLRTSYTVLSRTGVAVRVAALEWIPYRAKTVLLALHGRGGMKENSWGPLVVPRYSFALDQYRNGRATIAIDFPGYGESEGNPYLAGVEDYAFVVDQIADALHSRFEKVVGVGHSMGAQVVNVAQGLFASFDAIVPTAYSHGGTSAGFRDTCGRPPFVCPNIRKLLFTSHADRRVVEDFVRRLRPPSPAIVLNGTFFGVPPTGHDLGPSGDDVTATVTVPVLVVLGADDFLWDTSKYAEEPSHYPSSPDVKLVVLPRTGHALFHHLTHRYVHSLVGNWLTKHKL